MAEQSKHNPVQLVPFQLEDAERLIGWIDSESLLYQFAGPIFTYPLTREQIAEYLNDQNRKIFRVALRTTGAIIGHCELNYTDGLHRLSRILIGSKVHRGKGYGGATVQAMVTAFFQDPTVEEVDLNVFEWNQAAVRCYEQQGFVHRHEQTVEFKVPGATWVRLNMVLTRQHWQNQNGKLLGV